MYRFRIIYQQDSMDCGSACLAMIARHYDCHSNVAAIRRLCGNSRNGLSMLSLNNAAQKLGFSTKAVELSFDALTKEIQLPCILHWRQNHFIVVYEISDKWIYTADPALGRMRYSHAEFQRKWTKNAEDQGFALLLEPSDNFIEGSKIPSQDNNYALLVDYIRPYKKRLFYLLAALVACSLIQLAFPFLTQAIVDRGIQQKNLHILILILTGQLTLTMGNTLSRFIQGRLALFIGTRINITMVRDLLLKLVKLPIRFFDTRQSGDILQRILDQTRIETFITESAPEILLSVFSLVVFGAVLLHYDLIIFLLFVASCLLYIAWISSFLRRRRILDYERFGTMSANQDEIIQFVRGMQEIKLNNCFRPRLNAWTHIQRQLFVLNSRSLRLSQSQQIGGILISQLSDVTIIFIAAVAVLNAQMTLGTMLAIQYIVGSIRVPVEQIVAFIQNVQDVRISYSRLRFVYNHPEEKTVGTEYLSPARLLGDIRLNGVFFSYDSERPDHYALSDIDFTIPLGQTTAIVGMSGSGKTTLLKLLLGFYRPQRGKISVGECPFANLDIDEWRDTCGIVMQDGYLFSDSIIRNIAVRDETFDIGRIKNACRIACIDDFITDLPLGYNTRIGADGLGLSMGQKQRILIARAVYKNPQIVIFDEATNSLDATNERNIYNNLQSFFHERTTIIVAHRLSTVKNADQIIVMDAGRIIECGNHTSLICKKGKYFDLIQDQLELGN